ncbi:hypothetical protein [Bacillus nitroreducens]
MLHRLFNVFIFVGVLAVILGFIDIGREFLAKNIYWFVSCLWIGLIGNWFLERRKKRSENQFPLG